VQSDLDGTIKSIFNLLTIDFNLLCKYKLDATPPEGIKAVGN
jgi:hypothetical protein